MTNQELSSKEYDFTISFVEGLSIKQVMGDYYYLNVMSWRVLPCRRDILVNRCRIIEYNPPIFIA